MTFGVYNFYIFLNIQLLLKFSRHSNDYFSILSARDNIHTLNGSQDIQLLPNDSAFSNIKAILKYDSFKNMNIFASWFL